MHAGEDLEEQDAPLEHLMQQRLHFCGTAVRSDMMCCCLQNEPGAISLGFVHVGQDLEEQEELLECLLAFFTQYLLADDNITCIKSGAPLSLL